MHLSVIIINFRTEGVTIDCIRSIYKYSKSLAYEIIIVDNAPLKDNESLFKGISADITYIKSIENIGFGKANNLGMAVAKGSYFLLLNNDTLLLEDTFLKCYDYMQANPKIGLLGCKLLNEDLSYQSSFYPFIKNDFINHCLSNNPLTNKLFRMNRYFSEDDTVRKVGDVSGAFMLLHRQVYQDTKGFDPDFFLYCEETEWCRNRISKKYDIVYFPATKIIHLGGKSAPKKEMMVQSMISSGLFWYKSGWLYYSGFLSFTLLNTFYYLVTYIFSSAENKAIIASTLKNTTTAIPYWLVDILKFKRKFGSRNAPLFYRGAKDIFFK